MATRPRWAMLTGDPTIDALIEQGRARIRGTGHTWNGPASGGAVTCLACGWVLILDNVMATPECPDRTAP